MYLYYIYIYIYIILTFCAIHSTSVQYYNYDPWLDERTFNHANKVQMYILLSVVFLQGKTYSYGVLYNYYFTYEYKYG